MQPGGGVLAGVMGWPVGAAPTNFWKHAAS